MTSLTFAVLAAGSGSRLGGQAKQLRLLSGRPLWQWSIDKACQWSHLRDEPLNIILVVPPVGLESYTKEAKKLFPDVTICTGGASRTESALAAAKRSDSDFIMLHDGARPFLSLDICASIWQQRHSHRAVIPVLPATDAVKRQQGSQWTALPRDELFLTQTPQLFPRQALVDLLSSLSQSEFEMMKDEAELWIARGKELVTVAGSEENYKITGPSDWERAVTTTRPKNYRSGMGYDVHPLAPHRPLVLGGVQIPSPLGLLGHSDADILSHVAADALLSAASLPDIGTLWPASDEQWKGCRSLELLKESARLVRHKGWIIQSLSVVLTAQTPRLSSWHQEIVQSINDALNAPVCSLTFKSGETIPPVGTAQAMAAWAVALIAGA